jgi:hypothetical protein
MSLLPQIDVILLAVVLTRTGNKLKFVFALANSAGDKVTS